MPIRSLEEVMESRLCWPEARPRTGQRKSAVFKSESAKAKREIEEELARWGVRQFIISCNNQRIFAGDPAAAVWWNAKPRTPGSPPELRVLACDKWKRLSDNLHAIALTLQAMRALDRWGAYTGEQAAEGAKVAMLPGPPSFDWRTVLGAPPPGLPAEDQLALANARYRRLSLDAAQNATMGGGERMVELNAAIEAARKELQPPEAP